MEQAVSGDTIKTLSEGGNPAEGSRRSSEAEDLPRRILIVSDAWLPQINGVVRTYQNISHHLLEDGCELRIIGPADFPSTALPSYPEIRLAFPLMRRLALMIEAFDPGAIHIPVEGPLGWMARRWCLKNGRRFSTAFHTNFQAYVAVRTPRAIRARTEAIAVASGVFGGSSCFGSRRHRVVRCALRSTFLRLLTGLQHRAVD